jgi:hypothetical protein
MVSIRRVTVTPILVTLLALGIGACSQGSGSEPRGMDVDGGSAGAPASGQPMQLDDGGILLLADGAVIYEQFWARPCPADSTLSYESFARGFFQHYCLHCHSAGLTGLDRNGASVGVNFDMLSGIADKTELIWRQAGDGHTFMPAAGDRPTPDERRMLGEWLACGAPAQADAGP